MSARHHVPDSDPEAWGGLGWRSAPNPPCANPECTKPCRYDGLPFEDYCSAGCVRAHLGGKAS